MAADIRKIDTLGDVAANYAALFCDIWGVLHDGEQKSAAAERALTAARGTGAKVVLVSNSPRPSEGVQRQLDAMHVGRDSYDAIVTSGDVTRALISAGGRKLFHLGPTRDLDIYAGLDIEQVGENEAESVVATGLFHDEEEVPEQYAELLARLHSRGLPMICANPDIVVHRGGRLIWCAGALARDYTALGGAVRMAGKPYRPIYELAMRLAGVEDPAAVLAIGDGLNTDIRGAADFGIDALFVVGGIHIEELGGIHADAAMIAKALASKDLAARFYMPALA